MKRSLILLLLVALIPSSANSWGPMMMAGGVVASGCSEGSDHLILGKGDADSGGLEQGTTINFGRWQADHSCTIDEIVVCLGDTNGSNIGIRAAIYADSGGNPIGDPLATSSQTLTTQADGSAEDVHCALGSPLSITSGTYYHIAIAASTTVLPDWRVQTDQGGHLGWEAWTYSSSAAFPNLTTYSANYSTNNYQICSWGSSQ